MSDRPLVWHIGGADVDLRVPLLQRLRAAGFEVAAVGTGCREPVERAGLTYHDYPLESGVSPLGDRRSRRALEALFREHRPALVHAFDTKPCLVAPQAASRVQGVRCVRTITGMGRLFSSDDLRTRVLRLGFEVLYRRAAGLPDVTIFQNEDDRVLCRERGLVRGRDELIRGSGVDVEGLEASARQGAAAARAELGEAPVVTMIARVVESKGVREFQAAAASLRAERAITFCLVGPLDDADPAARELGERVARDPHVTYLGKRSDVPALLAASSVCVLPTWYREGLPRVLMEAAILGVPLVATPVPGCREVCRHEETGLVVEPRDAQGLASAVRRLLDDPRLAARLAGAASRLVRDEFSLDRVARDTAAIYRSLLREPA